ncbi:MAG: hypothetical protein JEZ02_04260 [Desulfatibacillum sp.]|nr:hypothetical protein [Desulfatibacillum sp.]
MKDYTKNQFLFIFGAIAAMAGFYIIITATSRYGIGLTMDGASYVACARSLVDGQGFYAFDGRPYIHWPPLFPLVLAGPALFGPDPVDILPWLHALVFGLIVFGFHYILQKNLKSFLLVVWGTLTALLTLPIINLSISAYAEPLFILLSGAYIYCLQAFLTNEKKACFVLACLFASLSCLQRYAGVILPVAGAVLIIAGFRHLTLEKRFKHAVILCMAAYLPLGVWLVRNLVVSTRIAGFEAGGGGHWLELVGSHTKIVMSWIFPTQEHLIWTPMVIILQICILVLLWFSDRKKIRLVFRAQNLRTMPGAMGLCFAFYWVFILFTEWFSYDVDNNPHRFLAVIQLPFYFLVLAWIDKLMAAAKTMRWFRALQVVTACLALFWIVALWDRTSAKIEQTMVKEPGLSLFNYEGPGKGRIPSDQKERLALCRWLESLPEDCPVYSNVAPFLYGLYGVKSMWAPMKRGNSEVFAKGVLGWRKPCAFLRFDLLTSPDYKGILTLQYIMDFPEGQAFLIMPEAPGRGRPLVTR